MNQLEMKYYMLLVGVIQTYKIVAYIYWLILVYQNNHGYLLESRCQWFGGKRPNPKTLPIAFTELVMLIVDDSYDGQHLVSNVAYPSECNLIETRYANANSVLVGY